MQVTLVDCPGHASLIRTIIGGAQIVDSVLLVVDITKGIQTQTAECIVIAEVAAADMVVVLNKIGGRKRGRGVCADMEVVLNKIGGWNQGRWLPPTWWSC